MQKAAVSISTDHRDLSALREQAEEVLGALENHLVAYGSTISRDERRSLLMCIHRLERGLSGKYGTDHGRTLMDWITA